MPSGSAPGASSAATRRPTRAFAEYGARAHGIPIHPTFLEEADLTPGFDVVILSQVLEHLQLDLAESDRRDLFERAREVARQAIERLSA